MTSHHLVDPEIAPMLDMFPSFQFSTEALPQIRAAITEALAQAVAFAPSFPDVVVTERTIPGPEGAPDLRVLIYHPKEAQHPLPGLLWLHAGGHIIGQVEWADTEVKGIVSSVGCVGVSVDYRLSPEAPFPGQVEDCYAALRWLHASAPELGVDPARLAVAGDSAGGGLAASVALLARDRGEVPLAFQLLIYPMLDDRTGTEADPHPYTGEFVWRREHNHFGWSAFLGQEPGGPDISPYAAPARAERLEGLPPTFIGVGALDLFLDEDIAYAQRLIRAGVPTELHVYPGAPHAFYGVEGAQIAKAATRDYLDALRRALRPQQPN
jgi:acetyl esterase/lipase